MKMKKILKFYTYTDNLEIEKIRNEIKIMEKEIHRQNETREKIQKNFDFEIPSYVLDAIAEDKYINLFINLARVNKEITEVNAQILRSIYCKK